MASIFNKLDHGLQRGDEVMADGEWWPVIGYALSGPTSGSIFTLKKRGTFEPCLGYRIDMSEITDCRRPPSRP